MRRFDFDAVYVLQVVLYGNLAGEGLIADIGVDTLCALGRQPPLVEHLIGLVQAAMLINVHIAAAVNDTLLDRQ